MVSTGRAVAAFVMIIFMILIFIFWIVPAWQNVERADEAEDEALAEYKASLTEVYGPDMSQWPKCHQDLVKYSEGHPLFRGAQPKLCEDRIQ